MIQKTPLQLRCGDLVDLQGDKFADPQNDNPALECEFQIVDYITDEGTDPGCIAVGFQGFDVVGFPVDHLLNVEPCPTVKIAEPREFGATETDLAASLACYCSSADWGMSRREFLENVHARIDLDLMTGEY